MYVLSFENRNRNKQLSCAIQTFCVTFSINNLCCRNQETPRNIKEYLQGGRDKIVSSEEIRVS